MRFYIQAVWEECPCCLQGVKEYPFKIYVHLEPDDKVGFWNTVLVGIVELGISIKIISDLR